MEFVRKLQVSFLLILLISISACSTIPRQLDLPVHSKALLKPDYYTVSIPSFDDAELRATIYQPALAPNETAPVIIHAHGFGMFRMPRPMSLYGHFIFSGIAAKKAWKNGYWVVSYDQRGHGQSRGGIEMMDPDVEVQDLQRLIDWIEDNIPRLTYEDDKPKIGMIGESYGGGVQLLGASLDDRIDAIVPITTWYDFTDVITPNQVVKSSWLTTLIAVGNIMNPTTMNSSLNKSYFSSLGGDIPKEFAPMMQTRSLSNACYCDKDHFPHADAFFIQGLTDVLFPVNEAVKNAQCLEAVGRDVRILATQNGHLLPLTQFAKSVPGYDVDSKVTCDQETYRTDDLVLAWFDEKLKNQKGRANKIPKVSKTHDKQSGSVFDEVPVGGQTFQVSKVGVRSGVAGLLEMPLGVVDRIANAFIPKKNLDDIDVSKPLHNQDKVQKSTFRPAFLPLHLSQSKSSVAGIPTARFEVSGDSDDILFVGIGLKKNGQLNPRVISEQIYPVRGGGYRQFDMPAISAQLEPGDVIGLVVSGYSNQYRISSRLATNAVIDGEVDIPLHGG